MQRVKDCIFCRIVDKKTAAVILWEDKDILSIMDLYPAANGHVLILPKRHIENLYSLPTDLGCRIMETAIKIANAIKVTLTPEGLNLVQANGNIAGQTIPHFHMHIVPRYKNDAIIFKFGHGTVSTDISELGKVASRIQKGLDRSDYNQPERLKD
jgi:histidine triad (HIT) family protein